MAQAPEHALLSEIFLDVLKEFSHLDLYAYCEMDRRRFDFACVIQRDWDRPLVGQTLWKHTEGIDKDIRMLLTADESEAEIRAYVARDAVKNRATLVEAVHDFRATGLAEHLHKLKVFWIPQDFDASDAQARAVISDLLRESIVRDILFNVVFGNLSGDDVRCFMILPPRPGLNLVVLWHAAHWGVEKPNVLARKLQVEEQEIMQSLASLLGCGFLFQEGVFGQPFVSLKGRVLLGLLHRLYVEGDKPSTGDAIEFSSELTFILGKLGLDPADRNDGDMQVNLTALKQASSAEEIRRIMTALGKWSPYSWLGHLFTCIYRATEERWQIDLSNLDFAVKETAGGRGLRIRD